MKKSTKYLLGISVVLLSLAGLFYGSNLENWLRASIGILRLDKESSPQIESLKIGGLFALSGSAAYWGEDELNATRLAIDEANNDGGINGKKIELIVEDAPAIEDMPKSILAFQKLVSVDKVNVIIGPTWDLVSEAIAPIADQTKTLVISPDTTRGVELNKDYKFFFSTWLSEAAQAERITQYIQKRGWKRIAVIRNNDTYSSITEQKLRESLEKTNVLLVGDKVINDPEIRDFRTYISQAKLLNPDALYIVFTDEGVKCSFMRQAQELGFAKPILGELATENPDSVYKCPGAMEGIIYAYPKQGSAYINFLKKYQTKYNKLPASASVSNAYDAAKMVIGAMRQGKLSGDEIRASLLAIDDYNGVTAEHMKFGAEGSLVMPSASFIIKTVRNGAFEIVE